MRKSILKSGSRFSRWSRLKRSRETEAMEESQTQTQTTALEEPLDPPPAVPASARQSSSTLLKDLLTEKGFVQPMPPLAEPEDGEALYEAAPKDAMALLDAEAAALKAFPLKEVDEFILEGSEEDLTPEQAEAVRNLPPVETLKKDSDFTPFFNSNVPDYLKRHAFKALWASSSFFNFRDGLDDYDENFRFIDKLITAADSDYKAGKGYGLEDKTSEDDLGDGEDDVIIEDEKLGKVEEKIVAADEKVSDKKLEKEDENSEKRKEPSVAKDPRKSDIRPPEDAV